MPYLWGQNKLFPTTQPKKPTAAAAAAKSHQSCPTLCDPRDSSPPGSRPWDSPGKNTGVGCHFLLQCMKVKSESEVAQSCPIPRHWTVAHQAPPSMGFPRQEYWSGVPSPSPCLARSCQSKRAFEQWASLSQGLEGRSCRMSVVNRPWG